MNTGPNLGKWPGNPPRDHQLVLAVRKLAADSSNIAWTEHALQRLEERDITDLQVLRVLSKGDIVGPIEAQKSAVE